MKREINLHGKVWGYVDKCLASGLYGEDIDEVVLALMRQGLADAINLGILDLKTKPKSTKQ